MGAAQDSDEIQQVHPKAFDILHWAARCLHLRVGVLGCLLPVSNLKYIDVAPNWLRLYDFTTNEWFADLPICLCLIRKRQGFNFQWMRGLPKPSTLLIFDWAGGHGPGQELYWTSNAAVKKWNIHKDSQSKWQRSLFSISGCLALAVWAGNRRWHPIKDDTLMCSSALNSGNFLSYTQTDAARLAKVWCCFQSFPPLSPYSERIHLVEDRFRDANAQRFFLLQICWLHNRSNFATGFVRSINSTLAFKKSQQEKTWEKRPQTKWGKLHQVNQHISSQKIYSEQNESAVITAEEVPPICAARSLGGAGGGRNGWEDFFEWSFPTKECWCEMNWGCMYVNRIL